MLRPSHIALSLLAAVGLAAACSSKDPLIGGSTSSSNGSGATGGSASGGGGKQSGNASTGALDAIAANAGSGAGSGNGGAGGGCFGSSQKGKTKPLDIVLLLDRSLTMGTNGAWTGATKAMNDFVTDPNVVDVAFGVDFYPATNTPNECNLALYNPLQIPLAALPGGSATVVKAIQSKTPEGYDTPTHSAMFGALQVATTQQDDHPERKVVVVLATDGQVNSCNTKIQDIADLAKTAYEYNGVLTFAVAINGADLNTLNPIATAGGTDKPIDITSDITKLKGALDKIRHDVLGCEYPIPKPMMGEIFDSHELNITYKPGSGMPDGLKQYPNAKGCGNLPGWYYDNNAKPTKIFFCPATCTKAKTDAGASVDFVFGCPTEIGEPPK